MPKLIQNLSSTDFLTQVNQKQIIAIKRRGKYLLFHLTDSLILAVHLRMTGQLVIESENVLPAKATYLRLKLNDGNELRYRDQRKFGRVFLFDAKHIPANLEKLGPEPLAEDFTVEILKKQLSHCKTAIKKVLLNQQVIAGIGNIYADEALFIAGIHPARMADSLTEEDYENLYGAIRQVLSEGISHRGTTKRDYCDGEGKPGSYQEKLRVYGRKGLTCPKCQNMIVKMNFGGRGTHFCPICQK